ncbi:MAG: hypothetical protein AB1305_06120 [Candidatus Hadarchaeota archaeon]
MIGKIVCYTLGSRPTPAQRNRFRKAFLGYLDHSCGGEYRYTRAGLMSIVPHVKLVRSVFIVKKNDCKKVVDFLEKNGATVHMRDVILTPADKKALKC